MSKQQKVQIGQPEKVFYKIGEVSKMTGLESYVLRFWEKSFSALHPKKSNGGQRVYLLKDIQLILKIKKMLYEEGYTITGAKKVLKQNARPPAPGRDLHYFQKNIQRELKGILKLLN